MGNSLPRSPEASPSSGSSVHPGGGFYVGPTAGGDGRNAALAESLGIAVVSVDHRLAPEDP